MDALRLKSTIFKALVNQTVKEKEKVERYKEKQRDELLSEIATYNFKNAKKDLEEFNKALNIWNSISYITFEKYCKEELENPSV